MVSYDNQSAIKDKYCGIEIDINLHPEGFFIAEYTNPLNIDAPKLLDLMKSFPSIQYWWLDFKNLKYVTFEILNIFQNK